MQPMNIVKSQHLHLQPQFCTSSSVTSLGGLKEPFLDTSRKDSVLAVLCPCWQVLSKVESPTSKAIKRGVKLGIANVPKNYRVRSGAQLE